MLLQCPVLFYCKKLHFHLKLSFICSTTHVVSSEHKASKRTKSLVKCQLLYYGAMQVSTKKSQTPSISIVYGLCWSIQSIRPLNSSNLQHSSFCMITFYF